MEPTSQACSSSERPCLLSVFITVAPKLGRSIPFACRGVGIHDLSHMWTTTASAYQVISNFSEKTLKPERILDKPVPCIAFPLGEPALHDVRPMRQQKIETTMHSPTRDMSQPRENLNQTCTGLYLVHHAPHMLVGSNNVWVILRLDWWKVVVDG